MCDALIMRHKIIVCLIRIIGYVNSAQHLAIFPFNHVDENDEFIAAISEESIKCEVLG